MWQMGKQKHLIYQWKKHMTKSDKCLKSLFCMWWMWNDLIPYDHILQCFRERTTCKKSHIFDHFRTLLKKWWGISGLCAKKWWWWYFSSCATWQLHPLTINKNSLTSFLMISTIDLVKNEEKLKCIFFFLRKTTVSLVLYFLWFFFIGLLSFLGLEGFSKRCHNKFSSLHPIAKNLFPMPVRLIQYRKQRIF